jgi:hypothetical protein
MFSLDDLCVTFVFVVMVFSSLCILGADALTDF